MGEPVAPASVQVYEGDGFERQVETKRGYYFHEIGIPQKKLGQAWVIRKGLDTSTTNSLLANEFHTVRGSNGGKPFCTGNRLSLESMLRTWDGHNQNPQELSVELVNVV